MWGIPVPSRVPSSGLGWGKEIRSGSGVPADALGSLGDRYFDTAANRWYLKRWVGNLSGSDWVKVVGFIGASCDTDCSISGLIKDFGSPVDAAFFGGQVGANQGNFKTGTLSPGGNLFVTIPTYTNLNTTLPVPTGAWHKVSVSKIGSTITATVDGASAQLSYSGGTPSTYFSLGTEYAPQNPVGMICDVRASGKGQSLFLPCDDGAGTAVRDASGNGFNGALTDRSPTTFWSQAWVPMDLL